MKLKKNAVVPSHSISSMSISIFLNMKLSGLESPWHRVRILSRPDSWRAWKMRKSLLSSLARKEV